MIMFWITTTNKLRHTAPPCRPKTQHQKENSFGYSPTTKKQITKYILNFQDFTRQIIVWNNERINFP